MKNFMLVKFDLINIWISWWLIIESVVHCILEWICTGSNTHDTPKTTCRTSKHETPGGSNYYVPIVDTKFIPVVGNIYGTLEQCEEMYQLYATKSGFDIRKSTQKSNRLGVITKSITSATEQVCQEK